MRFYSFIERTNRYVELCRQHVFMPNCTVLGNYHGGNVGDNILRKAALWNCSKLGVNTGWQSYGAQGYPSTPRVILGGGAMGNRDVVRYMLENWENPGSRAALVGVDLGSLRRRDAKNYVDPEWIAQFAHVGVRNRYTHNTLQHLGLSNSEYHPDLSLSLPIKNEFHKDERRGVGINLVSMCMKASSGGYEVDRENEMFYRTKGITKPEAVGPGLIDLARKVRDHFHEKGVPVTHIPFTPADESFADFVFDEGIVEKRTYDNSPLRVVNRIAEFRLFIGCRYHANLFSILADTPLFSLSYATKCRRLWDDLRFPERACITRNDIADAPKDCLEKIVDATPYRMSRGQRADVRQNVRSGVRKGVNALR